MSLFIPDHLYPTVYDIPFSLFERESISVLFLDIDNTLVTYDDRLPTEENLAWFSALASRGIRVVFVSNNHKERVETYAHTVGAPYTYDAKKPFPKAYRRYMREHALSPANCMAVGDQIFTDVLAAHFAGCKAILVPPIRDLTTCFVKIKRVLEKPFVAIAKRRARKTSSTQG